MVQKERKFANANVITICISWSAGYRPQI